MKRRLKGWRRIADAMWHAPDDPQIYGTFDVDATALSNYLAHLRENGQRVTVTHLVGRALAHALAAVPEINIRLVAGYAIPRESVDIFFITAVEGGRELSGVKIVNADRKPAVEIAAELARRASDQKEGRDPDLAKTKGALEHLPKMILRGALRLSAYVAGDMNRSIGALGLRSSPFGSAMVSSVGMFGLPMGFAPISWMYKVPIVVLVGEIANKPVAVNGEVAIKPMLPVCATIDHRYADGWHIAKLFEPFNAYLADPGAFEGSISR